MHQLVYISTPRSIVTSGELKEILEVSRRNNERLEVTGLLVSGRGRFLQALEGPTAAVLATYSRIQSDPRHYACVILQSRSIDQRAFGSWSMAHEYGGDGGHSNIVDAVADLTRELRDRGLQAEFQTFAELHANAAA